MDLGFRGLGFEGLGFFGFRVRGLGFRTMCSNGESDAK